MTRVAKLQLRNGSSASLAHEEDVPELVADSQELYVYPTDQMTAGRRSFLLVKMERLRRIARNIRDITRACIEAEALDVLSDSFDVCMGRWVARHRHRVMTLTPLSYHEDGLDENRDDKDKWLDSVLYQLVWTVLNPRANDDGWAHMIATVTEPPSPSPHEWDEWRAVTAFLWLRPQSLV